MRATLKQRLVQAGTRRSHDNFSWDDIVHRFVDLYSNLHMQHSMKRRADSAPDDLVK
ncbi:MAG: hypothetical protein IH825_06200 [Candidatus Marinimicrobia bacterium]|nr:hypothetical protein [Candidatus Neomarinimicrobiota bacterium]